MRSIRSAIRGLRCHLFAVRERFTTERWRILFRLKMLGMVYGRGVLRRERAMLWIDGREVFRRLHCLTRKAKHTIVIQMFSWKDDRTGRNLASVLVRAADRGVAVHITKEPLGDIFERHQDFLTTRSASHGVWKRFWHHSNIHITHTHARDHAKVYLFDERTLVLSGMNVSDDYRYDWHDYAVELRGKRFAEEYLSGRRNKNPISVVSNSVDHRYIRPVLMHILASARRSIVLEHAYISDPAVLDLLVRRSRDGVRITIIIPARADSHHYANMKAMERLLSKCSRRNLRVYLYPRMVHGKVLLADFKTAFLGSANLMTDSLDHMGEVNVLIEGRHRRVIERLTTRLRMDVLRSRPLNAPPKLWMFQRVLGWLWL